jgi:hypothetical protein
MAEGRFRGMAAENEQPRVPQNFEQEIQEAAVESNENAAPEQSGEQTGPVEVNASMVAEENTAVSEPEKTITVEFIGDKEFVTTQFGNFFKGQTVEVNGEMSDHLLSLTDGDGEPQFTEV